MVRPVLFVLIPLAMGCEAAPGADEIGAAEAAVVYGADDRQQVYEQTDPKLRALAEAASVALVPADAVRESSGLVTLHTEPAGDVWELCEGERFASEPSVVGCSGVLVAPNIVLTAGHCLRARPCESWAIVAGLFYEAPDTLHPLRSDALARCAEVLAPDADSPNDRAGDYAWIRLDRSLGAGSLPDRWLEPRPVARGSRLVVVGHGLGIPAKVDTGALVVDPRANEADYFTADADNYAGGSGAGVFDTDGHLLGIAVQGALDLAPSPSGCFVTRRLEPGVGAEQIVRFEHARSALCTDPRTPRAVCGRADARSQAPACSLGPGASGAAQTAYLLLVCGALRSRAAARRRR